jgi:predicted dehydrogenase
MLRLGLLGCGGIAVEHLVAAQDHSGLRFTHLADVDTERARPLAERFGVARTSTDPACVVSDPAVDAVVIALPTFLHARWIARCARASKHVLTEKPLCRTVAEGRRAIGQCAEAGVALAVGYMRRNRPLFGAVREIVRSGALGSPVTWTLVSFGPRSDFYRGPANWMWDLAKGGGMVMDGSIHAFDFATWVLGPPVELFAQSQRISEVVTAPTQASAIARFADGSLLLYGAAWQEGDFGSGAAPNSIVGPRGTIVIDSEEQFRWWREPGVVARYPEDFAGSPALDVTGLFRRQLDSFVRLVETGERDETLASGEEALSSLWLAESIVAAGGRGRRRRWR